MLAVVKNREGDDDGDGYVVSLFVEGHAHSLTTPSKVHLLPSHRNMLQAHRALTKQLENANIPKNQQMSVLELQAGGLQNVGFLARDLYNVGRDRRRLLDGRDANMLYEHFEIEK